jgi:L-iditol 2-dehydrogenase
MPPPLAGRCHRWSLLREMHARRSALARRLARRKVTVAPAAAAPQQRPACRRCRCMSTGSTQPAAFLRGARDMVIASHPIPELPTAAAVAAGEAEPSVLIDVEVVGICGSDMHYYKDGGIGSATVDPDNAFVPGHEFAGRVVQDDSGTHAPGTLVAVDPAKPCESCEWCRRGHFNLCPHVEFTGAPPLHGALTRRMVVAEKQLFAMPPGLNAVEAMMLEPLGVAIHAIDLAKPRMFESVAVIGTGPIGLKLIQLCRLAGVSEIYGVDPLEFRAAAAQAAGADAVATDCDAVAEMTDGRGADLVIEATNSPFGMRDAVECARVGGRVVLVGIPDGNEYAPLDASLVRRKGLKIKTSRRMGDVYDRAIELASAGKVDLTTMVTHSFDLEDTPEAYMAQAAFEDGVIKSIVTIES